MQDDDPKWIEKKKRTLKRQHYSFKQAPVFEILPDKAVDWTSFWNTASLKKKL